ncbi:glutathione S-transferase [Mesorhizobium sp. CO1-1-7]|uniref:Glutathione S-transferase n=1 Tax=Mesorhizobium australicum (strain HAMBI 3006 / LMG 24608 / WSM2073) TaxID=754035 RepID=L0KKU2_MESAW|nr:MULTISPECIES: glutathione S-transferase [Mesorhizobium]AGB44668.1 glutathione S-transferase [Mesorhizobium australicum WSM2073]MBZ9725668.1 glutathione S-transferase [Mesorhizobium sp. CO1-1-11]MBZ9748834.1 glutathione S-transferase [Mesorhizobium sp. CO1-1-7]MBZ9923929.1 glutathione S-transferase [Mesorhizobium sp. BR1-1-4]MBZ9978090.1 glutathione S-transferase [Mesorhizobium sp. BR-1-1-10]
MILYYQTHSPFARKALVFAHEAGVADQLQVIHHETSPTLHNASVHAENPLGQVPVLLRPGAPAIFDSDVICAYLDTLHDDRKLLPQVGEARWQALRLQSAAQGLAQTGIALRWETERRPEQLRYDALAEGYRQKIEATYDWAEGALDDEAPLHVGHIALATTLSWMAFRHLPSFGSRARLTRWFEAFERRASMRATPLSGDTHD